LILNFRFFNFISVIHIHIVLNLNIVFFFFYFCVHQQSATPKKSASGKKTTDEKTSTANGITGSTSRNVLSDFDKVTTKPDLRLEAKLSAEVSVDWFWIVGVC